MQIRCPHCHVPFDSVEQASWADMLCPACGSSFSLSGNDATCTYRPGVQVLGHFELLEHVGSGRYGSVWKARDTQLQRTVAIKIPRQRDLDPQQTDAFLRDARAAAQLNHPNIAGVHEVGRESDTVYIVTDYIDGANLSEWLTGQRLTSRETAELVIKIAEALHHAHEAGVVHRDLKPSNIMLDVDGHPHVIDFGLARRETGEIAMTVEGQILGTPAYMSPEQARGHGHTADRRSDVYALGVILFELLTGELPFRGDARMLIVQILNEEPPTPRKLKATVPRDLETITLKCLQKDPARRYQTAQELADDLKRFLKKEPIQARPTGRPERAWRWCRRNPTVASLAAAVFVILTAGIAVSSYFAASASREATTSKNALAKAEQQQKRAEDVNAFFTDTVFGQADPNSGGRAGIGLLEALNIAETKIDERFTDDPLQRAVVRDRFGHVYHSLDQPKKAVEQFEKAIAARQPLVGSLDAAVLKSRSDLGRALYSNSDFDGAKATLQSALADQTKVLGEGHSDTIATAISLALVLMELHDPQDLALGEKTYNIALASHGPKHPLTLEAEYNYSWILRWRLDFQKALQFGEPAARGLQETLGEADPKSMYAAYNYASCLYELHQYKEAAEVFGPLSKVRNRVLGPTHVASLFAAWRYADSLQRTGDDQHALDVLDAVRSQLKEIEATGIARRTAALGNMEDLYVRLKHPERAAEIQEVIYRMLTKTLDEGDSHNIDFAFLRIFVIELALSPVPELHTPKWGLEIAMKACQLTEGKNNDALAAEAFAYVGTGDYQSAVKDFDKMKQRHVSAESQYKIALIRLKGGDKEGYRATCQAMLKAFATSTDDTDLRCLTWACALDQSSVDDFNPLLALAKRLVEKSPNNNSYLDTAGVLLFRIGNYEAAKKTLNDCVANTEANPSTATSSAYPKYFLAMTKWKLGERDEAKRMLAELQAATDKEIAAAPLWNRQATLELFRKEAESLINNSKDDSTSSTAAH